MLLFDVPSQTRVRIKAKLIRWVEGGTIRTVGRDITFEATTTNKFYTAHGARRRLLINHNIRDWKHVGIWQSNKEVEIVGGK